MKSDAQQAAASQLTPVPLLRLRLERSGLDLTLKYGESILDAIEEAGVEVEWMCRAGVCGTCELPVRQGTPFHRDNILTPTERASARVITPCVSWSATDELVLDV